LCISLSSGASKTQSIVNDVLAMLEEQDFVESEVTLSLPDDSKTQTKTLIPKSITTYLPLSAPIELISSTI